MNYKNTKSFSAFMKSPYRSIKHKSYFDVYDALLEEYEANQLHLLKLVYWMEGLYLCGGTFLASRQELLV